MNPIPNYCKGQPMPDKRVSNGGSTLRGVAWLTGLLANSEGVCDR